MDRDEILHYLKTSNRNGDLFQKADETRKKHCGDKVHLRGIIEFSNHCCRNCLYCGLRRDNKKIKRYRMPPQEIVALALKIARKGVKTIVLQSGDDFWYKRKTIASIITNIKKQTDAAITLSLGERPLDHYRNWRDAGADRYLMRHETANPNLYEMLHPGKSLIERLSLLSALKDMGYQIGAGNIVGIPGQDLKDLAEDIWLIKELDSDMAGIGPFIPQKDTPLSNCPPGDLELTLRALALIRITSKNIHLPATTAVATLDRKEGLLMALKAGANVIMPDFTPQRYSQKYQIYDNKQNITLDMAKAVIFKAKRETGKDKGDSLKCRHYKRHPEA
ncbi:MAG: [FeFe] hydrogenase H-cluster radical SAM maturase HydE [Desulfobacteraceae bacterium]|nr:[FeFe] hydrogenase H-cluster radical SAM maturase HydE [Desulfobacteraceae bacterium]